MTRILIGNDFSEDVREDRGWTGWWVQRLIWFAEPGDVLVLPSLADEAFFDYVSSALGFSAGDVRVIVPPNLGEGDVLSDRALLDPDLTAVVAAAVEEHKVTEVFPLWPSTSVARLARRLGISSVLPGAAFMSQAGGTIVNSKSAFRAVAAGAGLPLPQGAVCTSPEAAVAAITDLFDTHDTIVVKHDWMSGGRGNEILSTRNGVRPIGARRSVCVQSDRDVATYIADRWDWLSAAGRGRPVAEHYFENSAAYFVEFHVGDEACTFRGNGELLSAPYAVGQVMPAQLADRDLLHELVEHSRTLAHAVQAMGYRGIIGPDAIVTPDQELFFTEWNGRVTGSTHIYERIGRQVVGSGFGVDRVILDRVWPPGWSVSSFEDAYERLVRFGLAWSPRTRSGVILANAFDGRSGVMYCVASPTVEEAWEVDRALAEVFGQCVRESATHNTNLRGKA